LVRNGLNDVTGEGDHHVLRLSSIQVQNAFGLLQDDPCKTITMERFCVCEPEYESFFEIPDKDVVTHSYHAQLVDMTEVVILNKE